MPSYFHEVDADGEKKPDHYDLRPHKHPMRRVARSDRERAKQVVIAAIPDENAKCCDEKQFPGKHAIARSGMHDFLNTKHDAGKENPFYRVRDKGCDALNASQLPKY